MAPKLTDPFNNLPPELRIHILISTQSKSSILRMIQASPVMLRQYVSHKQSIIRQVLAAELDQDMVQDAMAIILLPSLRRPTNMPLSRRRIKPTRDHIRAWSKSELPDPLREKNPKLLNQLDRLYTQLMFFIEDYITKATDSSPHREYSCLPQLHRPVTGRYLLFKGIKVTPCFDSTYLTVTERRRFVKAFLTFELMCKVHGIAFIPKKDTQHRRISNAEYEAVRCVHSYFSSLYRAIFTQYGDACLPGTSEGSSMESRLPFPGNLLFNASDHAPNLDTHRVYDEDCAGTFARLGVDYITDFLGYDMANGDEREALKMQIEYTWDFEQPFHSDYWEIFCNLLMTRGQPGRVFVDSYSRMIGKIRGDKEGNVQHKIAQQGAWVFFDDSHAYPNEILRKLIEEADQRIVPRQGWYEDTATSTALSRLIWFKTDMSNEGVSLEM